MTPRERRDSRAGGNRVAVMLIILIVVAYPCVRHGRILRHGLLAAAQEAAAAGASALQILARAMARDPRYACRSYRAASRDWNLFCLGPLQSLCASCHNSKKQSDEARGYTTLVDE